VFEARTPLSRAWNCTGRAAAVDDLGLSVRKLRRSVAEKLQSRRAVHAGLRITDPLSAPNIAPSAARITASVVGALDGFAVELGERNERNDLVVDVGRATRMAPSAACCFNTSRMWCAPGGPTGITIMPFGRNCASSGGDRRTESRGADWLRNDRRLKRVVVRPFAPTLQVLPSRAANAD
jgi:hypothetical protein